MWTDFFTIVLQLARYRCLSVRPTVTLELWLINDTSYPKSVWKSEEGVPYTNTKHLFFYFDKCWPIFLDACSMIGKLAWHYCLSVRLSATLCIVAKRFILPQKCLNRWTESAPRHTILQISTLYTDHIAQTPHPQNGDNFLTYYIIALCWSRDQFVYIVRSRMGEHY